MEKILEKSGKSQGILSVRKSGNPVRTHHPVNSLILQKKVNIVCHKHSDYSSWISGGSCARSFTQVSCQYGDCGGGTAEMRRRHSSVVDRRSVRVLQLLRKFIVRLFR